MYTYDVPRRQGLAPRPLSGPSATPIYDALYAEYVRSFRSLPGDRSGEEELEFSAFGSRAHRPFGYGGAASTGAYSAYSAGAYSARQQAQGQRLGHVGPQSARVQPLPAALPPGRSSGV
ncbi:hypothetical protein ACL02U_29325 [Streptomyces sp. MS06]|uniref:hypothetical protein n=1 Tax=Streptomyces sp. MS06 TaxID=3385974 RepID=UPI0039A3D787